MNSPETKYLKDYHPSHFDIEHVDLYFDLHETYTDVRAIIKMERVYDLKNKLKKLYLHGEDLDLISIAMDGAELDPKEYEQTSNRLIINKVGKSFVLNIKTRLKPHENTSLSGLYVSNNIYCTQCEAEGFQRITYFLDRPDVLCTYTCTIEADKNNCPVLLSNGNLFQSGVFKNGRHWVTWEDPFPKPSYLFAMVAGDLEYIEDIVTQSEKPVLIRIFAEAGNIERCEFAMESLINAMFWDEDTFQLVYDLDTYMIVAINDFNMGAMENKGLNIFNSKCILADPEIATDDDYANIERIIAHEYFHNWTGNRVTLRNWFQLCLKEGLTVFRDQLYTEAVGPSRIIKRIQDVQKLRLHQFPEDDGPTAHPVRPDQYVEMNNFYTPTVYEKGAAIVRMLYRMLGDDFFLGMEFYFDQFDGQAVSVEDFLNIMEDAGERKLDQFMRWYTQAGTPRVTVHREYISDKQIYRLTFEQFCPPTVNQPKKEPLLIPIDMALLDSNGNHIPLELKIDEDKDDDNDDDDDEDNTAEHRIIELTKTKQTFEFINVYEEPVPSLFRDFSACVKVSIEYSTEERLFLLKHDTDDFNRWDQSRQIQLESIFQMIQQFQNGQFISVPTKVLDAFEALLTSPINDRALITELVRMPSDHEIAHYCSDQSEKINPDAIHFVSKKMKETIAEHLSERFMEIYDENSSDDYYDYEPTGVARRSIRNLALDYLVALMTKETVTLAIDQFMNSDNMTDIFSALQSLSHTNEEIFQKSCEIFYGHWFDYPLLVDKWFAVQAKSELNNTLDRVKELLTHPVFTLKNPNRVKALIGSFVNSNLRHFHSSSGEGYELLADQVLALDKVNPQIASQMVVAFNQWQKYEDQRMTLMGNQLERLHKSELSRDVFEIVSKALGIQIL